MFVKIRLVVLSTHIVQDIENLLTDVIVLRRMLLCMRLLWRKSLVGIRSESKVMKKECYMQKLVRGYHVITHKQENMDTEVSLELLFNALIKGGGRI